MAPTPQSNRRTRADHATEIAEDYVEAIADFILANGVCRTVDLARRFGVTPVTVNRTIGRLQRDGFVETEAYGPVELTSKGRRLARISKARHLVVLNFLVALGVPPEIAEIDSEGMEHHVSPETLKVMKNFTVKP